MRRVCYAMRNCNERPDDIVTISCDEIKQNAPHIRRVKNFRSKIIKQPKFTTNVKCKHFIGIRII